MSAQGSIKTESYICENCGGTMEWNITKQQFECGACRTPFHLEVDGPVVEHDFNDYGERAKAEVAFPDEAVVHCATCGAEVAFAKHQTATVCPMCSSTQVAAEKQSAGVPPDGIIPFKVDKAQAQEKFRKWVSTRRFAPNKLKQAYQQGKLEGVYIPFWTFDADATARYSGQGGRTVTYIDDDKKTQTKIEWHHVSGTVSASYDDIQVSATHGEAQKVVNATLPYSTSRGSRAYNPAYLSGFGAERYAFGADHGFSKAESIMESDLKNKANSDILARGFEQAKVKSLSATYRNVRYKHVLLPSWISAFALGDKRYLYAINGETGKVGGQRPYSPAKIALAILGAVLVTLLLVFLFSEQGFGAQESASGAAYSQSKSEAILCEGSNAQWHGSDRERTLSSGRSSETTYYFINGPARSLKRDPA